MALGPKLSNPSSLHFVGAFVLFQMLSMLGVGSWFGIKSGNLALNGVAAEGTVVQMTRTSKGSTSPVVEFSTPTGQRTRFEGSVASKPPAYHLGEKVTVLFLPSDSSVHVIQSFSEMWLLPSILLPIDRPIQRSDQREREASNFFASSAASPVSGRTPARTCAIQPCSHYHLPREDLAHLPISSGRLSWGKRRRCPPSRRRSRDRSERRDGAEGDSQRRR